MIEFSSCEENRGKRRARTNAVLKKNTGDASVRGERLCLCSTGKFS